MELEVLGSCLSSFILAAKELAEDERFKSLEEGWRVKVYDKLATMEALRVVNSCQKGQVLTAKTTFAEQAAMCRNKGNNMEVEEEEPRTMRGPTRKRCALALGRSTEHKALQALDPTFQLASYSRRCYMKAQEVFSNYQDKTGKHFTQFWFMKLQGLTEETRYRLLVEAASDLNLKRMGQDAEETKKRRSIKDVFVKAVGSASWEQACENYLNYTTEEAMSPYLGKECNKRRCTVSTSQDISVPLQRHSDCRSSSETRSKGNEKSSPHVNSSADDIKGNKVQATVEYAVICGPAALTETMVLMDRREVFQFLIEKFSSVGEVVLDNTHSNGAVTREACDLDRRGEQHKRLNDDDEDDDDETEMEEDSLLIPSHSTPDHPAGPYSFDEN